MKSDEGFSDMLDKTMLIDYQYENVSTQNTKQNSKTPEKLTSWAFFFDNNEKTTKFASMILTTFFDLQNVFDRNNQWERVYLADGTSKMSYQYKQLPFIGIIIEF